MKKTILMTVLTLSQMMLTQQAQAWGGRGHDTICQAATHLVKETQLKKHLQSKPQIMGHLCNVPDIVWKSAGPASKVGNAAHFINTEVLGLKVDEIPTGDYRKLVTDYTGKENATKPGRMMNFVPDELGSIWWRAEQFFRLATSSDIKKLAPPANRQEEQLESLPFNQAAYNMIVNMGLAGHFVGDASMPFHNNVDYDGYASGHGGIHAFYEETCVAEQGSELLDRVVDTGKKMNQAPFMKAATVTNQMRELTLLSLQDLKDIIALDKVDVPSKVITDKGMEIKTPAVRSGIEKTCREMTPLIVKHMGRSAALLAQVWDQTYVKSGKPDLKKYKSYKYPFTPDFVAPDYFDIPPTAN